MEVSRSKSPKPKSPATKRAAVMRQLKRMNEEQLKQAMQKKKECNNKAQLIVEKLLDPVDKEEEFLQLLPNINQEHYEDIVHERAITKICGFPLCKEQLIEVPAQQFHISTCTKKVYDLTERKNFCSGFCLRKSNYLKVQLLTSPLWMRDNEDIPNFKLLTIKNE